MAAGEVFVMILGEIDLSIGAVYLFTPFIWSKLHGTGIGLYPSLILSLVVAMVLGAINGFFVAYVGIASFVATLGMLFTLDGLTLVISHATPVQVPGTNISGHATTFSKIFGGGTYSELIWAIGLVILLQVVLTFTRWGLYTVSTGGNRLGAAEAGIRTRDGHRAQLRAGRADGRVHGRPRGGPRRPRRLPIRPGRTRCCSRSSRPRSSAAR